jgi:hypothetical protein
MRVVCVAILLAAATGPLMAQSVSDDAIIDQLLSQSSVTWGNAAWLVGRSTGAFADAVTPEVASDKAILAAWGPLGRSPDSTVNTAEYSQLLVQALKIPGGLMYSLFPSPRYAYRELIFRKLIPAAVQPDETVSGEQAMRYLQSAQSWKEPQQ